MATKGSSIEVSAKKQCIRHQNDGIERGTSYADSSTDIHEMATSLKFDYEVFLSFRGKDTRAGFTDFLYTSMRDVGIRVYKDDIELSKGKRFGPELLQAINQSKISIPIFSKGYASSDWCLKELVQMVECQKTRGQKIMPIFYDVAPSEVRYQTGVYEEAFRLHKIKERYDEKTLCEWKAALLAVGELDGWDLQSMAKRGEGEIAKTVTQKVFNDLKKACLVVLDNIVSVDSQVDKIMEMIGARTNETRIIGICGMGGIGKTTIAKIIYSKLSHDFECCCFLSNIREKSKLKGIEGLQNQLISDILKMKWIDLRNSDEGTRMIEERLSNKKVLLLLDDVGEQNHMSALVGKHDRFGKGSKLIITTRNKNVLEVPEVDNCYEVRGMDSDQSLQLFSRHAFRRDYPLHEYISHSERALNIARGLPLALEVIGSLLSRTRKNMWEYTLKKLEKVSNEEIQSKLKISYDALEVQQQHIFLDIACFLIGYDKKIALHFWDESKYFPEEAMEALQNLSLIKIENNEVWMHDQLRDLGRDVIRKKSDLKIQKQSRVWDPKEGLDLLRRYKGEKAVEALRLKFDHQHHLTYKDFESLSNLTFLEVDGLKENFRAEEMLLWHSSPSNSVLLPQLRWLSWRNIPLTFKITNFFLEIVVVLDLSESELTQNWEGWNHMEVMKNLKVLNLTDCHCLERTPKFSSDASLERLILRGCSKLFKIDGSICGLRCLVSLDVRYCKNLLTFPDLLVGDLASLECLYLKGCESLKGLPDSIGNLKSLIELDVSGTGIKKLPDSIENLKNLKAMKMKETTISEIPDALSTIEKLEQIEARGKLPYHVKIGNGICKNQSLRILRLTGAAINAIPKLPESLISLHLSKVHMKTFPDLSNLTNLKELDLKFGSRHSNVKSCEVVEDPMLPWIGNLSKLESLLLHSDDVTTLPTDISLLPQLKTLNLRCPNLCCLPKLPSSLLSLSLFRCKSPYLMDLSNLKKLSSLDIWFFAILEIRGLECLENLQYLRIIGLGQLERLPDLSNLNKLRSLEVQDCGYLVEIQGELPESLKELRIHSCQSLRRLPYLSSLRGLQFVDIDDHTKVNVVAFLGFPPES